MASRGERPEARLYEEQLGRTPGHRRTARHDGGRFYTPAPIARRAVRAALELLGCTPRTILDPSCGAGAFLLAAHEELGVRGEVRYLGFDTDATALAIASSILQAIPRESLALAAADFLRIPPDPIADLVLGNPPWISRSGRQSDRRGGEGRAAGGWPSLHGDFLLRAMEWLRPGGIVAFVLPLSVGHQAMYARLREGIAAAGGTLVACEALAEDAFEGVVQPAGIFVYTKGGPAAAVTASPIPGTWIDCLNGADRDALARLAPFPSETFGDPGVHTGNMADLLIHRNMVAGAEPCRVGSDIAPFRCAPASRWLRTDCAAPPGRYCRLRPFTVYTSRPILLRQTANRPIAARHANPTWFRNSVLACTGWAPLPHQAMVAILNSSLMAVLHRSRTPDARQRVFPQVKVGHLRALPAPPTEDLADFVRQAVPLVEALEQREPRGIHESREAVELDRLVARLYGLRHTNVEELRRCALAAPAPAG